MTQQQVPTVVGEPNTRDILESLLEQTTDDLEPISPEQAVQLYLEDKQREYRKSTVDAHRSRLRFFTHWCEENGIDNMNELTARDLHEYRVWRREGLNVVSEKTQMDTLRVFIEWCETIDAVQTGLFRKVQSPSIPEDEGSRETVLHAPRAESILEYLAKYEYGSSEHVTWAILVETGIRMGALRALDVDDFRSEADQPHLTIVHRPDEGTAIKNGTRGERRIGISSKLVTLLYDYLSDRRKDVIDEYDREPLVATTHGRVSLSTIRKYIYKWSRPCVIGKECPHDRTESECDAANSYDQISQCPSSVTPHPIRRGYITRLLQAGVPVDVVSDRCNVSPAIIDQHYDVRSEEDKMVQRQDVLEKFET